MTTLEQLYGCLDGSKGNLHDNVGAQLVAGRDIFLVDNDNNDPFSSCLMEMDLTSSSIADDIMVEDYARVPSPSSSSFVYSFTSPPQDQLYTIKHEEEEEEEVVGRSSDQMNAWTLLPACFQEQLLTHYGLYLKEIQQVLDMQQMEFQSDTSSLSSSLASLSSSLSSPPSVTSSPTPSSPASPAVAQVPKMEKKKKSTMSFKVDHYKLEGLAKRQKREECEPLSPTEDNLYNSYDSDNISLSNSSNNIPSPSSPSPRSLITVAEELASAFLPSVSQIEEGIRAGTSSASAATTVIELTKRPELLTLKQSEAARIMGISTSVLSKRWREATRGKKWPHRIHHKLKRAAIC